MILRPRKTIFAVSEQLRGGRLIAIACAGRSFAGPDAPDAIFQCAPSAHRHKQPHALSAETAHW
jgi:hypothetical protein